MESGSNPLLPTAPPPSAPAAVLPEPLSAPVAVGLTRVPVADFGRLAAPAAWVIASLDPPYNVSTAGPALTVRVLPSSPVGIAGRPLPWAAAHAWAFAELKVKVASRALMTTYDGPPLTRDGRVPLPKA